MSQTERLHKIKRALDGGACLTRDALLQEFGISYATLKRDLAYLRDRLNTPLMFDRERGGWRLDRDTPAIGPRYELPGLWLGADEIHALLTMQQLLAGLDAGGLLGPHIEPLMQRLSGLLAEGAPDSAELTRRIRVQPLAARRMQLPCFRAVGAGLLSRRQLDIDYHGRGRNLRETRRVSPQRLLHYRDNWYLDAWCHLREGLRRFAVDAIATAHPLQLPAIDVEDADLDAVLGAGYGIFSGRDIQWAHLRFSPERARWVAVECWHRDQRGSLTADGGYELRLPFTDMRELVMDLMRHVPGVAVLAPASLRDALQARVRAAAAHLDAAPASTAQTCS